MLGPCDQILWGNEVCGGPGFKTLGIHTYCTTHYGKFLQEHATRDARFHTGIHSNGVGIQKGVLCPEYGPGWAELECWACGAEWTGVIGDSCYWCWRSNEIMLDHQAQLVLTPPDCELSDILRPKRLEAWKERLKRARDIGIITREEAKNAFGRELRRTG